MENKKAQKALSVLMIVILITTVFSIAFMTESEKVIKKKNELSKTAGMEIISGMVVLSDILDIIAEEEREMVVSAKDGNFYLIRKKGYEWYYGDTTIKVTADSMATGFNYYKILDIPDNIEIKTGAPYCEECKAERFGELITGMVTGMERVSGFATAVVCYSADGKEKLAICPGTNKAHIRREIRDDGTIIKKIYGVEEGKPEEGVKLLEKSWAPKNDPNNFQKGDPPPIKSTTQTYVADIIDLDGKKRTYDIGEFDSKKEAEEKCGDKCKNVRIKKESAANDKKFYVLNTEGTVIGYVEAEDEEEANKEGKFLAENIKKDTFGKVERPTIEFSSPVEGGESIIYQDSDLESAKADYEKKFGFTPKTYKEIQPGTIISGDTYYLIDKDGTRVLTLNNIQPGEVKDLEKNYQKQFPEKGFKLEKTPSLEDLIRDNPGVSRETLLKEYQNIVAPSKAKPEEVIKEPKWEEVTRPDGKKVYYVNGIRYEEKDKNKAEAAFAKAQEDFIKAVTEKYAKEQLEKDKLKLTGEITENGELLAKDAKGGIHKFVPIKEGDKVTGGTFQPVGDTYTTKETIGKGDDTVYIIRTHKTDTKEVTEIRVTKDGESATVDEETVKQIKAAQGKGLKLRISSVDNNQVLEFKDKDDKLVAKTTLSAGYTPQVGTKTTEQFKTAYFYDGEEITKEDYDKLKKEEKEKAKVINEFPTFKREETTEKGNLKFLTTYEYDVEFDKDKNPIVIYEGTKYDLEKGELVQFIYGEGNKNIILGKDGNKEGGNGDDKMLAKAKTALSQYKSRQFFATLDFAFTEFRGLGYFATWFMSDKELEEWREAVDKFFAEAYLGIEYWVSGICAANIDRDQRGVAYVETRLGLAGVAAHIEATRSYPIISQNATEYLYKITFYVKNGDWEHDPKALEEMGFNIYLYGDRTSKLLSEDKKLKRGEAYGRIIENAIVQYTEYYYNKICIKFKEVPSFWTLDNKELCNTIQGPSKGAERAYGEEVPEEQDETVEEGFLEI